MPDENYYKVGGSLEYQHPTYVVRQADADLYDGLKDGEFCYVLNSRQMGKSSLRVQMMKKLKEQGVKCASIDMTRIGSHVTQSEWYAGVISELLRGFSLSRKVNFSSWWREREALPPLQRLRELIEDVLLVEFSQNLVIFVDEIDSIIKIKFKEDFFAFIRACYNQRVDNPDYNRLTFCLLGVATPSDLITDKNISTPFNIGRAIELTGFQLHEVQPLIRGLAGRVSRPEVVIREVVEWTGGQPFLTQKLCKQILNQEKSVLEGREAEWVEELVRSRILENWETQDEPEHLRTIRDRILWSPRKEQLLRLYQQILETGEVRANDTPEHIELRLSGLVVKQQGKLKVYNRIYASVFNHSWVESALSAPFRAEIQALELAAFDALQQFESQQIEALVSAMQAGQALKTLLREGCSLQDYPAVNPLSALQTILENIHERNYFISHKSMTYDVCFSPNGQILATTGDDGTVWLWNLFGRRLMGWQGHLGKIDDVSFSPDGELLATAGQDGTARLWNLSGQQITRFDGHQGWVRSVSFSSDGQLLATAGADRTARLWNLSGRQITQFKGHQDYVWSASFSPNGSLLATAGSDGTVRLWNLSGRQITQFKGHQGEIWCISFSPDGQMIATAGADQTARLWSLSGEQLAQLKGHEDWVRSVSFSPNGQSLATGGDDGTARLWNLSGQQLAQVNAHVGIVLGISFSSDGQYLATASSDGMVKLWDWSEKDMAQWNSQQTIERLDELLRRGFDWLKYYFVTHPEALEKLKVCQNQLSVAEPLMDLTGVRKWLLTTTLSKSGEGFLGEFLINEKLVRIYQGDITNLETDVIVSSDDTYLQMSGGVSRRIREVGGNEIYKETRSLIPAILGHVVVTTAGKLRAKKIFHGVVIDWHSGTLPSPEIIQSVVHKCIEKANKYTFNSIAFSLLGTGAGCFSTKVCWEVTLSQIISDLAHDNQTLNEVIIVLYEKRIIKELNLVNFLK